MKTANQNGFTITELVFTIALLAIFIPGISGIAVSLDTINDRAREVSDITMAVDNKVESLRSKRFANLTDGTVNFTSELPATVTPPRSASYTISTVNTKLKKVSVTVSYNDRGTTRTFPYTTFIGASGVGQ